MPKVASSPVASVIITTYNQPEWLEKVLVGYGVQDRSDFEVVVADDGSTGDTKLSIERLRGQLPIPVRHVWQADQGFRKCEALNMAIRAARADYLIFTDGDCVPRTDFVSTHLRLRQPGRFLSGGYNKLPMETSRAIEWGDIRSTRCFELSWLRQRGLPASRRNIKLVASPNLGGLLDVLSPARASWNGHNASVAKCDALAVNGFDERLKYGGEDREFGERLQIAGISGKRIRHRALVLHLDHSRGYVTQEGWAFNRSVRAENRRLRRHWTDFGLKQ